MGDNRKTPPKGASLKDSFETHSSSFAFHCHYPEENSEGAEKDIVKTLSYIGVFDDIKNL